jgi:hypothetical protein
LENINVYNDLDSNKGISSIFIFFLFEENNSFLVYLSIKEWFNVFKFMFYEKSFQWFNSLFYVVSHQSLDIWLNHNLIVVEVSILSWIELTILRNNIAKIFYTICRNYLLIRIRILILCPLGIQVCDFIHSIIRYIFLYVLVWLVCINYVLTFYETLHMINTVHFLLYHYNCLCLYNHCGCTHNSYFYFVYFRITRHPRVSILLNNKHLI